MPELFTPSAPRPNPPHSLRAVPLDAGGIRLSWAYEAKGQEVPPHEFLIYHGTSRAALSYDETGQSNEPYAAGKRWYSVDLRGEIGTPEQGEVIWLDVMAVAAYEEWLLAGRRRSAAPVATYLMIDPPAAPAEVLLAGGAER